MEDMKPWKRPDMTAWQHSCWLLAYTRSLPGPSLLPEHDTALVQSYNFPVSVDAVQAPLFVSAHV